MASYKVRGNKHNVIYTYKTTKGKHKSHWETYSTAMEAIQRKGYIDHLQKKKAHHEIRKAALEYQDQRAVERAELEAASTLRRHKREIDYSIPSPCPAGQDNTDKTYREFGELWLPYYASKNCLAPSTYDHYKSNLEKHIYPYFGDRIMSRITAQEIDTFINYTRYKPVKGYQNKATAPDEIKTLSSGSVKKIYQILNTSFGTAKQWGYVNDIPQTSAPSVKCQKRKTWTSKQVYQNLAQIEDKLLHLAVHLAFVCSLRVGETCGIAMDQVDLSDQSLWVTQEIQRVSDQSLFVLPKDVVIRTIPKQNAASKTALVIKRPKTEGSVRKIYLTNQLCTEIRDRLEQIQKNKDFYEEEYHDYGLLICWPNGLPIEPSKLLRILRTWQMENDIEPRIDFHGLRKSGQMHKIRLSQNNFQLVAESAGHSPVILMRHYNDIHDAEKRELANLVERNFYPAAVSEEAVMVTRFPKFSSWLNMIRF